MSRKPRRQPRYSGFLYTGGAIGLVADIVVVLGPGAGAPSPSQLFLYLGLLLTGIGALLGGLVAVVMEGGLPRRPPARDEVAGDAPGTTADP